MLTNLKNIFKVQDLRNKVLFTLAIILLYRLGAHLPVPGIDVARPDPAEVDGPRRAASSASSRCSRAGR